MAWVVVTGVTLESPNPAPLNADFSFQVSFNCMQDLEAPLSWRLVYVGDAEDKMKDQELEAIELGPIKRGQLKFTFESDPPDFSKIDPDEIWGTTVLLLEASYRDQDFVRIGWYVHNYYTDPILQEDPPDLPILEKMVRFVLVDEPRVTQFNINWTGSPDFELIPHPQLPGMPAMGSLLEGATLPAGVPPLGHPAAAAPATASSSVEEIMDSNFPGRPHSDGDSEQREAEQCGNSFPSNNYGVGNSTLSTMVPSQEPEPGGRNTAVQQSYVVGLKSGPAAITPTTHSKGIPFGWSQQVIGGGSFTGQLQNLNGQFLAQTPQSYVPLVHPGQVLPTAIDIQAKTTQALPQFTPIMGVGGFSQPATATTPRIVPMAMADEAME